MRIFVTGVCGQLGHDVANEALARGYEVFGSGIETVYSGVADGSEITRAPYVRLDIKVRDDVISTIEEIRPDVMIHCAGWTDVDGAEEEANMDIVHRINADGTRSIAEAAKQTDAKMIYISTDYVFDGKGDRPWQPDDKCYKPLNVYGKSKLDGELAVKELLDKYFIVRTSWVFGLNGKNFIKTMINIGKTHDQVRVVNDQTGTPTYSKDLAKLLVDMASSDKFGYYHAANEGGYISWYDLCVEVYKQYGLSTKVIPVSSEEYGISKAKRPLNSRLDTSKLALSGFDLLPDWKDAVRRYLAEGKI